MTGEAVSGKENDAGAGPGFGKLVLSAKTTYGPPP